MGLRGLPDEAIRQRLAVEADLLFLTQDTEFAELPADTAATVLISRVPQAFPIARRVEVWEAALDGFLQHRPAGRLFEPRRRLGRRVGHPRPRWMREAVTRWSALAKLTPSTGSSARSSCHDGSASNIPSNILGVTGWHPTAQAGRALDKTAGQGTC